MKIVVSNTFTQEWEMQPYYQMAERYNYRIHSVIVENRHEGVNEHNVPEEKLSQMKEKALSFSNPDAAKKIAESAIALAYSHEE